MLRLPTRRDPADAGPGGLSHAAHPYTAINGGRRRGVTHRLGPEPAGLDLGAVDELCRLAVAANRLGCRVQLLDVEPALRDLLVLSGVDEVLLADTPDPADLA